jgi:hypothetical protein
VQRLAPADGAYQLIGQEVRAAGVSDLPLAEEVIQGAEGLVDRCRLVVAVQLVQIDVVGLQAAQGRIHGREDVLAGVTPVEGCRAGRSEALCGHDEAVSFPVQPPADNFLRHSPGAQIPAQGVGIGSVEEVDTALGGTVEDGDRRFLIALQAERHRPQAQSGNLQAGPAESGVLHELTLPVNPLEAAA